VKFGQVGGLEVSMPRAQVSGNGVQVEGLHVQEARIASESGGCAHWRARRYDDNPRARCRRELLELVDCLGEKPADA
jgi:hypothetical protein